MRESGVFPLIVCGGLVVLSVLLVVLGHRQGDSNAIKAATATAIAAASAKPSASGVQLTTSSSAQAAAASAAAKPAAAD